MANYTYLSIKKDEENTFLFEGKNALPFFWICLLDHKMISSRQSYWEFSFINIDFKDEEEDIENNIDDSLCVITISNESFNTNSSLARTFIEKHLDPALPLYDDFIACIANHLSLGGVINIELLEYICLYDTAQEFINSINKEITAIQEQDLLGIKYLTPIDLINGGTGFTSIDNLDFKELDSYKQADDRRQRNKRVQNPNSNQKSNSYIVYFFIILIVVTIIYTLIK